MAAMNSNREAPLKGLAALNCKMEACQATFGLVLLGQLQADEAEENIDVRQMLKGLTTAQFVQLSREERVEVYEQHLVLRNETVQVHNYSKSYHYLNPKLAVGNVLRQVSYMGDDAAGRKIVREARKVYYGMNKFEVPLHLLSEFLFDPFAATPVNIAYLVLSISVSIELEHSRYMKYNIDKGELTENVGDLMQLSHFIYGNCVEILLHNGGALDGSDPKTQAKMKEMFPIVKELNKEFEEEGEDAVSIRHVYWKSGDPGFTYHDLEPYFKGVDTLNARKGKTAHQWGWGQWPIPQASKCQHCKRLTKKKRPRE